jgi:hypothetical protein
MKITDLSTFLLRLALASGFLSAVVSRLSLLGNGASLLTLLFALAMTYSFGIKEPLGYSVFVFSTGAFLLATMPYYKWSLDQLLIK